MRERPTSSLIIEREFRVRKRAREKKSGQQKARKSAAFAKEWRERVLTNAIAKRYFAGSVFTPLRASPEKRAGASSFGRWAWGQTAEDT
jgi:hypothetical protein